MRLYTNFFLTLFMLTNIEFEYYDRWDLDGTTIPDNNCSLTNRAEAISVIKTKRSYAHVPSETATYYEKIT